MAAEKKNDVNVCPRRGRPRLPRIINSTSESRCYKSCCCPEEEGEDISLQPAWRDLHEARRKLADALVNGKGIQITGCRKEAEGRCPKCTKQD